MYRISDFSKITNITVKALRYYDEEGILTPSHRGEENSYRFYDENDFRKARLIQMLRTLDFSICEIKDILSGCENTEDLSYYLEEKKKMIECNIKKEKELIKNISLYIKPVDMEDSGMNYEIEVREIAPVTIASIRYKGRYDDVGKYIGKIYKAVKNKGAGAPFNCYYDAEFKEEADIELCVPTKELIKENSITSRRLPGIKAICTTHKGSYDNLNLAYKALLDYEHKHGLNCLTPSREIYLKGPGMIFKGNPNNYVTEIILPIEVI